MTILDQTLENSVEEYMTLIRKTDELITKFKNDIEKGPEEKKKEVEEQLDDVEVIRNQLITQVKQKGISREIIEKTSRLLSIF